jgi:hypothetical protein
MKRQIYDHIIIVAQGDIQTALQYYPSPQYMWLHSHTQRKGERERERRKSVSKQNTELPHCRRERKEIEF